MWWPAFTKKAASAFSKVEAGTACMVMIITRCLETTRKYISVWRGKRRRLISISVTKWVAYQEFQWRFLHSEPIYIRRWHDGIGNPV